MRKLLIASALFMSSICCAEQPISIKMINNWAESQLKILCHEINEMELDYDPEDVRMREMVAYRMGKIMILYDVMFLTEEE